MSIYIKGMEMPSSCMDCPLNYDCMGCSLNGVRWWSDTFVRLEFDPHNERLLECPLVELPEHGDLIDRNELEVVYYEGTEGLPDDFDNGVAWLLEHIDKMEPIIPASGGEENVS